MHAKKKQALTQLRWACSILDNAYARNDRIFVRVVFEDLHTQFQGGEEAYLSNSNSTLNFKEKKISLLSEFESHGEEMEIELPSAPSNIHKWAIDDLGLVGCGKTFFFDAAQRDEKLRASDRWRILYKKSLRAISEKNAVASLKAENLELRRLVQSLVDQLQTQRRLVYLESERVCLLREEISRLKNKKSSVTNGPWASKPTKSGR